MNTSFLGMARVWVGRRVLLAQASVMAASALVAVCFWCGSRQVALAQQGGPSFALNAGTPVPNTEIVAGNHAAIAVDLTSSMTPPDILKMLLGKGNASYQWSGTVLAPSGIPSAIAGNSKIHLNPSLLPGSMNRFGPTAVLRVDKNGLTEVGTWKVTVKVVLSNPGNPNMQGYEATTEVSFNVLGWGVRTETDVAPSGGAHACRLDRARLNLGVGEKEWITVVLPENIKKEKVTWNATGVTLSGKEHDLRRGFEAPGVVPAASPTVTIHVEGYPPDRMFTFPIHAPEAVTHAVRLSNAPIRKGLAGAGMRIDFFVPSNTVCFRNVTVTEDPEGPTPATNQTGYFEKKEVWSHDFAHGANHPARLRDDNSWSDNPNSGSWEPPFAVGHFEHVIKATWQVGKNAASPLGWTTQAFDMAADGTSTIRKFDASATRNAKIGEYAK